MEQSQIGPKGEGVGATESKDTESTVGTAGLYLAGQAGAEFQNPSTSELARVSENTSLTRCAGDPAGARIAPEDRRSEVGDRQSG